jgi:hypothetical protein
MTSKSTLQTHKNIFQKQNKTTKEYKKNSSKLSSIAVQTIGTDYDKDPGHGFCQETQFVSSKYRISSYYSLRMILYQKSLTIPRTANIFLELTSKHTTN